MTTCPDLDRLLADVEADQPAADVRLERHVESCAVCLAEEADLVDELSAFRALTCPPEVIACVLAEVRAGDRPAVAPPRRPSVRGRTLSQLYRAAGLGAAVLVGLAVWTSRGLDVPGVPAAVPEGVEPVEARPQVADAASEPDPPAETLTADAPPDPTPRAAPPRRTASRARSVAPRPNRPAQARTARAAAPAEPPDAAAVARARAELELALSIVGRAQHIATETISIETQRVGDALRETRVF